MKRKQKQTWIFAFTDLAFLLLISLSLIPSAPDNIVIHFSEMELPDVPSNPNMSPVKEPANSWELQVRGITKENAEPFRLVKIGMKPQGATEQQAKYIDREDLIPELMMLKERSIRPLLLPEKTSLSNDFLYAAGAVARVWSLASGHTIVKPINPEELHPK
jgi:hypothetical protein